MAQRPTVVTTWKDLPADERVSEIVERRCHQLADEFHEVTRIEFTFAQDGTGFTVHSHVTGKARNLGAQAEASELLPAVDRVLARLERQLRTLHDKTIFGQRREAQRHPPKKRSTAS